MITIEVPVADALAAEIGRAALQQYLTEQVELLRLRHLSGAIEASGIDLDREMETIKTEVWQTYKTEFEKGASQGTT